MKDGALVKVAQDFREGILQGRESAFMCRAICLPLQSFLSAVYQTEVAIIDGEVDCGGYEIYHTWLELKDGRILDPTADQFPLSLPPVFLGPQPARYSKVDFGPEEL